jgi:hypothetical protein
MSAMPDDMAAYGEVSAERLASLEALKRTAAEGLEGLDAKRGVLRALLSWPGPDEDVCLFAAHLAEEVIAVSKHYHALVGKMNNASAEGTVGGAERTPLVATALRRPMERKCPRKTRIMYRLSSSQQRA